MWVDKNYRLYLRTLDIWGSSMFHVVPRFLDTASLLSGVCILLDNRQETFTEFAQPSHAILMLGCGNSRLSEENDGSHQNDA